MKTIQFLLVLVLVWGACKVEATTWIPRDCNDPISGTQTQGHVYLSYGSYIYDEPSKFDLVFWPYTDEAWIWLNTESGYGAFGDDFESISAEEVEVLRPWLAQHYDANEPPLTHAEKLLWLEQVYGQRQMDEAFWCHFYRLMAYTFWQEGDQGLAYVRKALPLLENQLAQHPEGVERIEILYLLGEYQRRVGERALSKSYWVQAETAEYVDEKGVVQQGYPYIESLIQDRRRLRQKVRSTFALACLMLTVVVCVALGINVLRRKRHQQMLKQLRLKEMSGPLM